MFKKIFLGLIIGFISGMFASGGGLVLIPLYNRLFCTTEKETRASTIFCILPMVITTSLVYGRTSDFKIGILCAIGGVIGSFIGSICLQKLDTKYLKIIFIVFLFYSSIKLLVS